MQCDAVTDWGIKTKRNKQTKQKQNKKEEKQTVSKKIGTLVEFDRLTRVCMLLLLLFFFFFVIWSVNTPKLKHKCEKKLNYDHIESDITFFSLSITSSVLRSQKDGGELRSAILSGAQLRELTFKSLQFSSILFLLAFLLLEEMFDWLFELCQWSQSQ